MKHPGFSAVQSKIEAKEGVSREAAGAILASSTRKASASAKKKKPGAKESQTGQEAIFRELLTP